MSIAGIYLPSGVEDVLYPIVDFWDESYMATASAAVDHRGCLIEDLVVHMKSSDEELALSGVIDNVDIFRVMSECVSFRQRILDQITLTTNLRGVALNRLVNAESRNKKTKLEIVRRCDPSRPSPSRPSSNRPSPSRPSPSGP